MTSRGDLSWALRAVVPHAKTDVGIDGRFVFATDRYTAGLAQTGEPFGQVVVHLPPKEAAELERFVRPKRKTEHDERVESLVSNDGTELHVACGDETAVFELCEPTVSLSVVTALLDVLFCLPPDRREQILDPQWAARFAKAQRAETDVMRVYPRMTKRPEDRGVAIVTVGDAFVGTIAGRCHDDVQLSSLLASCLQIARKEAVA